MKKIALKYLVAILKILAKWTIKRYNPVVVSITGNVGKTSTKSMIAEVLKEKRIRSSSKSFNNEIGVPLVILGPWKKTGGYFFWFKVLFMGFFGLFFRIRPYPEILVLEYGIDRPGDMGYLLSIARPQVAVFTSLGKIPVHVEFFSGREGVLREKSKLISSLPATGLAVLNGDEPEVAGLSKLTRAQSVFFGLGNNADFRISGFSEFFNDKASGVSFKISYEGSTVPIKMEGVLGLGKAFSAAAAAAVGVRLGVNMVKVSSALADFKTPPGRLSIIKGKKKSLIIDDTYNSSPNSTEEALRVLRSWKTSGKKIAVLGDMLELGDYSVEAHKNMGILAVESASIFITIGELSKLAAEEALRSGKTNKNKVISFFNLKDLVFFLEKNIDKGDVVLLKASQAVRLEKVVKAIMSEPAKAEELLVRQEDSWRKKPGMYE